MRIRVIRGYNGSLPGIVREFVETAVEPYVRGFLHQPDTPNGNGLALAHGAGGNSQAPLLRELADTFCAAGFTVLRCDLPFRQLRPFGPPGPGDAARDRAGLKNALAALKKHLEPLLAEVTRRGDSPERGKADRCLFLGGHSYGGRQSSMLCADEPDLAAGLLLLSYPLHPPRRPEQQRTQHLPDLRTPTLFVQGRRDPFGTIEEIEQAIKMIPARTKLLKVEDAGHDLGFKARSKQEGLPGVVFSEFANFFSLSS